MGIGNWEGGEPANDPLCETWVLQIYLVYAIIFMGDMKAAFIGPIHFLAFEDF